MKGRAKIKKEEMKQANNHRPRRNTLIQREKGQNSYCEATGSQNTQAGPEEKYC
jgi:hypothetical protein